MNPNKQTELLAFLLLLIFVLLAICLVGALTLGVLHLTAPSPVETESNSETESEADTDTSVTPMEVLLEETEDAGTEYIDKMIFFGESTTAHLRARGVLSGGTETQQVWADASNTRMLSSQTISKPIIYPPTGESITIAEACKREKPTYLVLSFGQNGLESFIADKSLYVNNYCKLISAVQKASPNTNIILQTVYPICGKGNYSADLKTLNEYIDALNTWLPEIAAKYNNVRVVDTASVLKNAENQLNPAYNDGDGIHLTVSAYEAILNYLRTHAWQ